MAHFHSSDVVLVLVTAPGRMCNEPKPGPDPLPHPNPLQQTTQALECTGSSLFRNPFVHQTRRSANVLTNATNRAAATRTKSTQLIFFLQGTNSEEGLMIS